MSELKNKLGFGLMRLPKEKDGSINIEETKEMVDTFIDNGFNYFDTAYVYDGGESEKAAKLALVDRYPRESFELATKMNPWMGNPSEKEVKQQFYTSLERTGAGYFDYYLLHAIQNSNYEIFDKYNLWNFVKDLKEKGLIKKWGFSFHASPELLDKLLTDHPDVDFVQLQINYGDWEDKRIAARENYEVARKHNKPVIIMEPVKGGSLANPIKEVKEVFDKNDKEHNSYASWAIRFAASLDGVYKVLSGMSNLKQMNDNVSYMKDFKPFNEEETKIINEAQAALNSKPSIPCTNCHYCTDGCPQEIPIPEIFKTLNRKMVWDEEEAKKDYLKLLKDHNGADACISCEQCVSSCPQQIQVSDWLKKTGKILEV